MRHITQLLAVAAALLLAIPALAADKPPFPRLAGVKTAARTTTTTPPTRQSSRSWTLPAGLLGRLGKEHGMTMEQVVRNIKSKPGDRKCSCTRTAWKWPRAMRPGPRVRQSREMKWWAFPRGGDGEAQLSPFGKRWTSPPSWSTPPCSRRATAPAIRRGSGTRAGRCSSSTSRTRRSRASSRTTCSGRRATTRTGTATASPTQGLAAGRQMAARRLSQALRAAAQLMPGKLMIGNVADWGRSDCSAHRARPDAERRRHRRHAGPELLAGELGLVG